MKKRILFFIPTLSTGGAERVLINLVRKLVKDESLDIMVLTLFKDKGRLPGNVQYHYVFPFVFRGNVHLLKLFPASFLYKRMIARWGHFDIVVSYLQGPSMRIVAGCKESKTKIVNWIHSEFHSKYALVSRFRNDREFEKLMSRYDAHVFVANSAKEALRERCDFIPAKKMYVIYNVNDYKQILEQSEERIEDGLFNKNEFKIISVGRFTKQKAFDRLITITDKLLKSGRNVHLYLLGKGEFESSYINQIEGLGINDKVTLLGYQSNPFKYVRCADLFVCSSLYEGFSTAVTEALVVGIPVVTTKCSGMVELLGSNNEYGIITENNTNELYKAVEQIVTDKELYQHYKMEALKKKDILIQTDNSKPVVRLFSELLSN